MMLLSLVLICLIAIGLLPSFLAFFILIVIINPIKFLVGLYIFLWIIVIWDKIMDKLKDKLKRVGQ